MKIILSVHSLSETKIVVVELSNVTIILNPVRGHFGQCATGTKHSLRTTIGIHPVLGYLPAHNQHVSYKPIPFLQDA